MEEGGREGGRARRNRGERVEESQWGRGGERARIRREYEVELCTEWMEEQVDFVHDEAAFAEHCEHLAEAAHIVLHRDVLLPLRVAQQVHLLEQLEMDRLDSAGGAQHGPAVARGGLQKKGGMDWGTGEGGKCGERSRVGRRAGNGRGGEGRTGGEARGREVGGAEQGGSRREWGKESWKKVRGRKKYLRNRGG